MLDSDETNLGIGAHLKKLREQKGISFQTVAEETRLPDAKLKLIEADEFDQLGDEVFVQGYIRRYAKAVDADNADDLVSRYLKAARTQRLAEQQDLQAHSEAGSASDRNISANPKALAIGAAAGVLVVAVLLTYFLMSSNEAPPQAFAPANDPIAAEQTISDDEGADDLETNSADLSSFVSSAVLDESGDESAVNTQPEPNGFEQTPLNEMPSAPAGTAATTELELASQQTDIEIEAAVDVDVDSQSQLDFSFVDECWVEVADKNGNVVFADLQNSGDNLRLFGQAPFSIMLGNVHALASLTIDGAPVEVQPLGTRKTRRLTVKGSN